MKSKQRIYNARMHGCLTQIWANRQVDKAYSISAAAKQWEIRHISMPWIKDFIDLPTPPTMDDTIETIRKAREENQYFNGRVKFIKSIVKALNECTEHEFKRILKYCNHESNN